MIWQTGKWRNSNSNAECSAWPECPTLDNVQLGYHFICEDTTSPFIRPSPKRTTDEREALLPSWGPEYKGNIQSYCETLYW